VAAERVNIQTTSRPQRNFVNSDNNLKPQT